MLTQEEFGKIVKIIDTANNRIDCLYNNVNHKDFSDFMKSSEHKEYHKKWLMDIQDDLGKLTDYLVDEVKIEEEK